MRICRPGGAEDASEDDDTEPCFNGREAGPFTDGNVDDTSLNWVMPNPATGFESDTLSLAGSDARVEFGFESPLSEVGVFFLSTEDAMCSRRSSTADSSELPFIEAEGGPEDVLMVKSDGKGDES